MSRIIFLDFDGVIRVEVSAKWRDGRLTEFCRGRMKSLAKICAINQARVVVSSDWRQSSSLKEIKALLAPQLCEFLHDDWRIPALRSRWSEVQQWLDGHADVESYVILEDTRRHFQGCPAAMEQRIAWCENRFGLVPEVEVRVMQILENSL